MKNPASSPKAKSEEPAAPAVEATEKPADSLVNENVKGDGETSAETFDDNPSYEELARQLSDSREEVRRNSASLSVLQGTITDLKSRAQAAAQVPVSGEGRSVTATKPIAMPDTYSGPGLNSIYLALLQGFTSGINPLKDLSDKAVTDLAISLPGIAEVMYHRLIQRPSFNVDQHSSW